MHDARLAALGLELPPVPARGGRYVDSIRSGDLLFLAGKGPRRADGSLPTGKVGADVTVEEARLHARLAGLNLLAVLQRDLGSLDRVAQIVKVVGLVNAVADFTDHPKVIDGCSELFGEVFGEAGAHARTAFGAGSLPGGMTVEVEAVVQIKP